jgi:hypothetical protein
LITSFSCAQLKADSAIRMETRMNDTHLMQAAP